MLLSSSAIRTSRWSGSLVKSRLHRISLAVVYVVLLAPPWAHAASPAASSAEARTARYFESVRSNPNLLLAFLHEMPKGGDLHNHLSGSIYAESFIQWAAEAGDCVSPKTMYLSPPPCDAPLLPVAN